MANKILKPCSVRGCPRRGVKEGRCLKHQIVRLSGPKRGYGGEWLPIRKAYLRAYPFCALCGGRGSEVHHKISIAYGGSNSWDNLETLCHECHSKVTIKQEGMRTKID